MRNALLAVVASLCAMGSGLAHASDPAPQQSASEIAASLAGVAPSEPAAAPIADHVCPAGKIWADDEDGGSCEPAKEGTAGFNLGATHRTPGAPSATTAVRRPAPSQVASISRVLPLTRPGARKDLLITFISGSSVLTAQARSNAHEFAMALTDPRLKGKRFEIAGYTDASGSAAANLALSKQRAEAVKAFIVAQGIDGSLLEARGYGAEDLVVPSDPKAAANRRVEAKLLN
jgi:outer membrane protein OmpA-like peptidoglycan-associated protein